MSTSVWALLCAVSTLLGFILPRRRQASPRHSGGGGLPDETTFATLHVAALAAPSLRAGLTRDSARKAIRHLRTLLGTSAIAVTDADGVLAWDGEADCHRDHAPEHARTVLSSGRSRVVTGGALTCGTPGCAIRAAAIVPLTVDGRVVGALAAYDVGVGPALVRTVTEVARWVSCQLELAELDSSRQRAMEAETRALRAQISPHFIYNSLTTIASFVRSDPNRSRELLLDFADFTRYSFRRHGEFTTLAEELRSIDRYLTLERARFGDQLQVTLRIAPEVLAVAVPFLCLQPLVENAVRHGLESKPGVGRISIVAEDTGAECRISVEDDGVGMDPERLRRILAGDADERSGAGGVGLANVDERLRQVYGDEYGLVAETGEGAGTRVSVRLPKYRPGVSAH